MLSSVIVATPPVAEKLSVIEVMGKPKFALCKNPFASCEKNVTQCESTNTSFQCTFFLETYQMGSHLSLFPQFYSTVCIPVINCTRQVSSMSLYSFRAYLVYLCCSYLNVTTGGTAHVRDAESLLFTSSAQTCMWLVGAFVKMRNGSSVISNQSLCTWLACEPTVWG